MPTKSIDLQHTLDSGQVFRYHKENDGYRVIHGNHAFFVDNNLEFKDIPASEFDSFFRLDDDYNKILKQISSDPIVNLSIKQYPGLRLLRQDPWECTISFLCSSATNIPRIKRDLNNIARTFGQERNGFHLFPRIGEIDNLQKLQQCGTGYRAKFIHVVNNTVTQSFFNKLKKQPYEDAKASLMELPGIGPKIAECILLFSLDHLNAFPIDTHIQKVVNEHYKNQNPQEYFSPYAGYAQQFLYHWRRNKKQKNYFLTITPII